MAGTCNKFYPYSLYVVVGIVQGMDLQLATVAGTGVYLPDGQRLAQNPQQLSLNTPRLRLAWIGAPGRGFADDAGACDLF